MTYIRVYKSVLVVFLILLTTAKVHASVSLNGVATHTELGKELFIAGLYTATPSKDRNAILLAQEEKQIQVRVTDDKLSSRRFKRMWIEGMAVNASPQELKEQSNNMATFANMINVRMIVGDIFTVARYVEGTDSGVRISINGALLGEISDPRFFDLLLRTWLGPVPLSSEFRSSLAQAGDIDAALLARFEATVPTDERIVEVEEALRSRGDSSVAAAPSQSQRASSVVPTPSVSTSSGPAVTGAPPPLVQTPNSTAESKLAIAPPTLGDTKPDTSKPTAPKKDASTPPKTDVAKVANAKPTSIIEEDDDSGPVLTAESIYQQQIYVNALRKHTYNFLKYPTTALNRGREGNLRMNVIIDREGNVMESEFTEESTYSAFNKEAEKAVKRASPFPPVPKEVTGTTFTFTLPIVFVLGN